MWQFSNTFFLVNPNISYFSFSTIVFETWALFECLNLDKFCVFSFLSPKIEMFGYWSLPRELGIIKVPLLFELLCICDATNLVAAISLVS